MHTPTIFDQTDRAGTFVYFNNARPNEYLSDSNSYNDESDCESDDYNNYVSNYESDNEETPCASTSITVTPLIQLPNVKEQKTSVTYTLR